MDGRFYFCFGCMRHHRLDWLGTGSHFLRRGFKRITGYLPRFAGKGAVGSYEPCGPRFPILLRQPKDDRLRPDEHNIVKEIRLSVRQIEEAGKLKPGRARWYKRHLLRMERKHGAKSTFFKEAEVEFSKPADLDRKIMVGYN